MLGIQATTAVVCGAAIRASSDHERVFRSLERSNHTIIDISEEQMNHYCANLLELQNAYGERFLVMSKTAYAAFSRNQLNALSQDKTIVTLEVPTIEAIGGGSARCMLAELFLPLKQPALALGHQR